MRWILTGAFAVLAVLSIGRVSADDASVEVRKDPRFNALVWMQTSAEYAALTTQAYGAATLALDRALRDRTWTAALEQQSADRRVLAKLPPAIILDIDETVLDNTPFYGWTTSKGQRDLGFRLFADWARQGEAKAIPGALEFIAAAEKKGITVFFVTNRGKSEEDGTRKNLTALGVKLPADVDTVLTAQERPGWLFDKISRRADIASRYRILVLVGDDFGDFSPAFNGAADERKAAEKAQSSWWGTRWFILPNPLYGSWERAAIPFPFGARPEAAELETKSRAAITSYK